MNQCRSCSLRTLPSALVWRILCALPAGRNTPAKLVLQPFCPLWYFFFFLWLLWCAAEQPFVSGSLSALFLNDNKSSLGGRGKGVRPSFTGSVRCHIALRSPSGFACFSGVTFLLFLLKRPKGRAELWLPVHTSNNGKPVHSLNRRNFNKLSSWVNSDHNTSYSFFNII